MIGSRLRAVITVMVVSWVYASASLAGEPLRVEFVTEDDVRIVGDYWAPGESAKSSPVVILLHMYKSDRSAWTPLVPELHKAGFAVLAIDMRGHGGSTSPANQSLVRRMEQRDPELFRSMYLDVAAAYTWLQGCAEVDLSRFAIVGASVGSSVAIDYARRDRSVDVLVLLSPGAKYVGLDSVEHIRHCQNRAILMLTSEKENNAGADLLAEEARTSQIKVFPESDIHGTGMLGKVDHIERTIAGYLAGHIGQPSASPVYSVMLDVDTLDLPPAFCLPGTPVFEAVSKFAPEILRVLSDESEARARGLVSEKERARLEPVNDPWHGLAPGSYVTMELRSHEGGKQETKVERHVVSEIDKDGRTIRQRFEEKDGVLELRDAWILQLPGWTPEESLFDLVDESKESIVIDGQQVECTLRQYAHQEGGTQVDVAVWENPKFGVPYRELSLPMSDLALLPGTVKADLKITRSDGQCRYVVSILSAKAVIRVNGRDLECFKEETRIEGITGGAAIRGVQERWLSLGIPGHVARDQFRIVHGEQELSRVMQVTAYENRTGDRASQPSKE